MATQQDCIDACFECAKVCDMCAAACIANPEIDALRRCLKFTLDCSEICNSAARMMARDSDSQDDILRACAGICEHCAEECRRQPDNEHCAICAEACSRCADLCHAISGTAVMA
jgi:hypothetical protein